MTRWSQSLVGRLVAGTVLVGLVVAVGGALIVRRIAEDALRSEVEREHRGVAERLAAVFDSRVGSLGDSLRLLGTRGDLAALQPDPAELAVALRATDSFDAIALYGIDGQPVAGVSSTRVLSLSDVPSRPELSALVSPGSVAVRVVGDGFPELEVLAPVENPPGTVVGAVVATAPVEIIAQGLQARFLGPSAQVVLVRDDGKILAHPERDRVLEGQEYPLGDVFSDGERVASRRSPDGDSLAAVAPSNAADASVVVEQEEGEALARVGDQLAELTVLMVLVVGVIVLALVVIGTRSLRPLAGLVSTMERIGRGDRSARADVTGTREFRAVAEEINHMADALDARMRELEATQRDLAAAEARFRTAFSQAPVGVALADADGRYQQVNPAFCKLLARSEHELLGMTWRDITHPDDVRDSERVLDAAVRSGDRAYHIEKRYLKGDREPVWVLLSVAVVRDGDTHSFIAHVQDTTAHRQATEEREAMYEQIVAAEQRARAIIDAAPDATLVVDADGAITFANPRVAATFGYQSGELLGKGIEVLLPQRFRERHVSHREGYVDSPRARPMGAELELVGLHRDGSEFPVEVSLSPLTTDEGYQVVAAVRDMTERREAAQTALALEQMEARQRQAMELNDNIVQGLTVAKWAFERERLSEAGEAIERTLIAAQELIQAMLREASAMDIRPGDLVRERPAGLN